MNEKRQHKDGMNTLQNSSMKIREKLTMLKIMKKPIVFKSEAILTQATMKKIKKVVEKRKDCNEHAVSFR